MSHTCMNPGCWFEIPVSDLEVTDMGPNPVVFFPHNDTDPGIGGHLYPGKPSQDGNTVHLMAPPDLDAMRDRIRAAGGSVESPDIPIPSGAFFYARDPDGNSIGFFNFNAKEQAA